MEKFEFNPPQGFMDVDAFPDPLNENETREQMQRLHDQLADFVNKIVPGYNGEAVMIRFDSDLRLEYSLNGVDWFPTLASGHIVLDQNGAQLPNRGRLQFKNAVIRDDAQNGYTIVECSTGEAGPGVPEGGTTNQVLAKASVSSFDTEWKTLKASDVGAASVDQVNQAINYANTALETANSKAPSNHNHDSRYFTEDETKSLLNSKAEKNHNHDGIYSTPNDLLNVKNELNSKVNKAAEIVFPKNASTISIASSTNTTEIPLFTAPASGFYFIEFNIEFAKNSTGDRFANMNVCAGKGVRVGAAPKSNTLLRVTSAVYLAPNQTVNATALQDSGSTLSCTYWCRYSYIPM